MNDINFILHDFRSRLPMALGYRLVWTRVTCAACPGKAYRGTDRRLWILDDDFMALSTSLVSDDPRVREEALLWKQYMDSDDDRTLHRNAALAAELASRFCRVGVDAEMIYSEIVDAPQSLANPHAGLWCQQLVRLRPYLQHVADVDLAPAELTPVGFDICWPDGRHSAIRNPGLERARPEFPGYLNNHCLFPTQELASRFLDSANSMDYGVLPFCVLAVWAPPTGVVPR
jgi:hypothetical protein